MRRPEECAKILSSVLNYLGVEHELKDNEVKLGASPLGVDMIRATGHKEYNGKVMSTDVDIVKMASSYGDGVLGVSENHMTVMVINCEDMKWEIEQKRDEFVVRIREVRKIWSK